MFFDDESSGYMRRHLNLTHDTGRGDTSGRDFIYETVWKMIAETNLNFARRLTCLQDKSQPILTPKFWQGEIGKYQTFTYIYDTYSTECEYTSNCTEQSLLACSGSPPAMLCLVYITTVIQVSLKCNTRQSLIQHHFVSNQGSARAECVTPAMKWL